MFLKIIFSTLILFSCQESKDNFEKFENNPQDENQEIPEMFDDSKIPTYPYKDKTSKSNPGQDPTPQTIVDRDQGNPDNGKLLYDNSIEGLFACKNCHGADGEGLGAFVGVLDSTDADFQFVLQTGPNPMPKYDFLTTQEMNDIAAYVEQLKD